MNKSQKIAAAPPKEEQSVVRVEGKIPAPEVSTLPESCSITGMSLTIKDLTSQAEWKATGKTLNVVLKASPFYVGDWVLFGINRGFIQNGQYEEAAKATSLKSSTLKVYTSVARCIPPEMRINGLSFQHHQVAAGCPAAERKELLQGAFDKKMTVKQFKASLPATTSRPPVPHKKALKRLKKSLQRVVRGYADWPEVQGVIKAIDAMEAGG